MTGLEDLLAERDDDVGSTSQLDFVTGHRHKSAETKAAADYAYSC